MMKFLEHQVALQTTGRQTVTAIEHLQKFWPIIQIIQISLIFNRLWIEILADQHDFGALQSLDSHLSARADA